MTANQKKQAGERAHLRKHCEKRSFNKSGACQKRRQKTQQINADFSLPLLWEDHNQFSDLYIKSNQPNVLTQANVGIAVVLVRKSHCRLGAVSQPSNQLLGKRSLLHGLTRTQWHVYSCTVPWYPLITAPKYKS